MLRSIPECIAYVSSVMTVNPGDLLLLGTNHQGIGPLQDDEAAEMHVEGIGTLTFRVSDSLKRSWPKEIDAELAARVRNRIARR
jgi:2-keto-4-pentenoate hydratase/2-oxohepta-3-ene-1,7-dioic acid hydratase in catechol pathway